MFEFFLRQAAVKVRFLYLVLALLLIVAPWDFAANVIGVDYSNGEDTEETFFHWQACLDLFCGASVIYFIARGFLFAYLVLLPYAFVVFMAQNIFFSALLQLGMFELEMLDLGATIRAALVLLAFVLLVMPILVERGLPRKKRSGGALS